MDTRRALVQQVLFAMYVAVAPNVQERNRLAREDTANEQSAVAVGRVFLAAHDRDAAHGGLVLYPFESTLKKWRFGDPEIQDVAFIVVELVALWPSAERVAHEEILDSPALDRILEFEPVEVRDVARIR